jgi:hypothetical protein
MSIGSVVVLFVLKSATSARFRGGLSPEPTFRFSE